MTAEVSTNDDSRTRGPAEPAALVRQLVGDFRRVWVQMTVTDMVFQAATFVAFAPAIAFVLRLFLIQAGEPALANTGNLWFLLQPAGVFAVVVIGGLILCLIFAEAAVLQLIAFAKANERRLSWHASLRLVARRAVPLFQLGVRVFLRLALVAAPFVLGMLFVAYRYLTDNDINYYLSPRDRRSSGRPRSSSERWASAWLALWPGG